LGRAIRATSQDRDAAVLQGIDVPRVYAITFGIGVATLGIAACFISPFYYIHPSGFLIITIRAYMVVVVGGLGSITGAIAGGLFIGLVESLGSLIVTATSADIFVFILFVAVLLLKPSGLIRGEG
jgi:branched-chain amino acid transport system permease protein